MPVHDDRTHFEFLSYEVMQCGLSWNLVYSRRDVLRECFAQCDPSVIANFEAADVDRILATPRMIRSPRKIAALINNAQHFLKMQEEFGSFDTYLWQYTDNVTLIYDGHASSRIPALNDLSKQLAKDLKARGFSYLDPTVLYLHLQAAGLIAAP